MSLPLSRRLAQAALLVAAGATPLAAAGSATAAELMPKGTDLGSGISKLDGVTSASTVKGEAHQVGQALGRTGAVLSGTALPAMADTAGLAAGQVLPRTDHAAEALSDPGAAVTNATTNGSGPLADTLGKAARLTPLGGLGLLPAAAPRAMPLGADQGAALAQHGPAMPTVTGVDKVLNADTLSHPLNATGTLAQQIPATSGLAGQLPDQERLSGALGTDRLSGALPRDLSQPPALDQLGGAVPAAGQLGEALPATHPLAGQLAATDELAHGVPAAADLQHPTAATDAAHLAALEGQATGAAHRLGGLPDLSGVTGSLTGAAGGLSHLPTVN
ncbi:hypothetical protein ACFYNO_08640 [Kitasatospora sp. NPDC006697]|uniref:hypothetical protein n=1 Tax=Kitasatospora sp. NPDC006697 TaxID=3364020 RepID=UPI003678D3EB